MRLRRDDVSLFLSSWICWWDKTVKERMQGKELRMYRLKRDKEKIGPVLVQATVSLWSASLQRVVTLAGAACAYGVHI